MPYRGEKHENKELFSALDEVCTFLSEGEIWHRRSGNECRKLGIRGWGQWHDAESLGDKKCHDTLDKLLMDKLKYAPEIDTQLVDKANRYIISTASDFKIHHKLWMEREVMLIQTLNIAIEKSGRVDMELYQKLCALIKEVQNEVMRVDMARNRLDLSGWNGMDIGTCSKWIHDYFVYEYKLGEDIDFNIG